jgi:CRISPR-associated protein Csb1
MHDVLARPEARKSDDLQAAYTALSKVNTIEVEFNLLNRPEPVILRDYDLPGRASDALIRSAHDTVTKGLMDKAPDYLAAMTASVDNSLPLATLSPISLLFGTWDSRRPGGVKVPALITGETYGVSVDQTRDAHGRFVGAISLRGGARIDPLAPGWGDGVQKYLVDKGVTFTKGTLNTKKKNGAPVGLGNVPHGGKGPDQGESLNGASVEGSSLGGVACSSIYRTSVIDLSALKRVGFRGIDAADQEKGRAAFLALAVLLEALSRNTLNYRVGTVLDVMEETSSLRCRDARGVMVEYEVPTVTAAAALLEDAIAATPWLGWAGVVRKCVGDAEMHKRHAKDTEDESTTAGGTE